MAQINVNDAVLSEVGKVIVGKDDVIRKIWIAVLSKGHVLLEDVPGTGKTTLAMAFSKVLGLDAKRIQFTPDTMPSDIIGFSVYENGNLKYKPGAVMTNILLADEINRTSAKTQSALLEAMEEGNATVDGITHQLPEPFIVLATQNPIGTAGTQNLPSAQLDRFLMKLSVGYPDHESQINMMKARHMGNPLDNVGKLLDAASLLDIISAVERTNIADPVYEYIVDICEATRNHEMVQLGVSPRASIALCRAVKAKAYTEGRDFVKFEDVKSMVPDVFSHRIVLSPRARLHDMTSDGVICEILEKVKAPVLSESNL